MTIGLWITLAFLSVYGGFRWACKARAKAECKESGHRWKLKESGGLYCKHCLTEVG